MNIGPTGGAGEDAALEMLLKNGFELVARNYHTKFGEIDLIVKNEKMLLYILLSVLVCSVTGGKLRYATL